MRRAVVAIALLVSTAGSVQAARAPDPSCWFDSGYLYAAGLPTTYPVGLTSELYPSGIGTGIPVAPDGTFVRETSITTAYFWVRGHGTSLIKAGPQLNDYHVIATCSVS